MYYLFLKSHNCSYEIYEILTLYYPGEKITICSDGVLLPDDCNLLSSSIELDESKISCTTTLGENIKGKYHEKSSRVDVFDIDDTVKKSIRQAVKMSLFRLLREYTGIEMPWGILVGIRPSKIVNELKSKGVDDACIRDTLKSRYMIRNDKIDFLMEVSHNSYNFINNDKRNVSIYIGISFCPSRCIYCSFASYPIAKYENLISGYLSSIEFDIKNISPFINENFRIDSIYIGGGTPSSLDDSQFNKLLSIVAQNFDISRVNEFTVEVGRPDTLNNFKLKAMLKSGVSRISINPQTMNDDTLKRIGRCHSTADIIEKFHMARDAGFDNINMDMILGLPGENLDYVKRTLSEIIKLSPENITVHSLAVKRASKLKEKINENGYVPLPDMKIANETMEYAYDTLRSVSYMPYYMYRQKEMAGNLENAGYCKKGYECIYNIQEIEEKETIIGFGADSVTKAVFLDENRIERFGNKKDIVEYIDTINDSSGRKLEFLKLLT